MFLTIVNTPRTGTMGAVESSWLAAAYSYRLAKFLKPDVNMTDALYVILRHSVQVCTNRLLAVHHARVLN